MSHVFQGVTHDGLLSYRVYTTPSFTNPLRNLTKSTQCRPDISRLGLARRFSMGDLSLLDPHHEAPSRFAPWTMRK